MVSTSLPLEFFFSPSKSKAKASGDTKECGCIGCLKKQEAEGGHCPSEIMAWLGNTARWLGHSVQTQPDDWDTQFKHSLKSLVGTHPLLRTLGLKFDETTKSSNHGFCFTQYIFSSQFSTTADIQNECYRNRQKLTFKRYTRCNTKS